MKAKIIEINSTLIHKGIKNKYGLFVLSTKDKYINDFVCYSDNKKSLINFSKGYYTIIK